jgi:hypothetical protein
VTANVAFAILVVAFGAGTVAFGWWTVPVIGLIWGVLTPSRTKSGIYAALGAALSWALLMVWTATQGPVWALARRISALFGTPSILFFLLPPILAALLAGSAALVAGSLTPPDVGKSKK